MSRYTPGKLIKVNRNLHYSPDEGCFRSNVEEGFIGFIAGTVRTDEEGIQYRELNNIPVAKLVWRQERGEMPARIYHKNFNQLDCRIENLTTEIKELDVDPGGELIYMGRLI